MEGHDEEQTCHHLSDIGEFWTACGGQNVSELPGNFMQALYEDSPSVNGNVHLIADVTDHNGHEEVPKSERTLVITPYHFHP